MKVVIKNKKREKISNSREELLIDVGGLTEDEAEDFVDEVKRRVTIRTRSIRDDQGQRRRLYSQPPTGGGPGRRVIDVNINLIKD